MHQGAEARRREVRPGQKLQQKGGRRRPSGAHPPPQAPCMALAALATTGVRPPGRLDPSNLGGRLVAVQPRHYAVHQHEVIALIHGIVLGEHDPPPSAVRSRGQERSNVSPVPPCFRWRSPPG